MDFNSDKIPSLGKNIIKRLYKQRCYYTAFLIVDFPCNTLLGLTICNNLNLVSLINVIIIVNNDKDTYSLNEYKVLFEGLGCLPITYHIHIDNNIQPKILLGEFHFECMIKLEAELNHMVHIRVVEKNKFNNLMD